MFTRKYKHRGSHDITVVGKKYKQRIMNKLEDNMKKHRQLTFFMVYGCKMAKFNVDGEVENRDVFFHSRNRRLLHMEEFEEEYEDAINGINGKLGDYMGEGSGWQMDSINTVNLSIARYNPIRGSSFIKTPSKIANKGAVINVDNSKEPDDKNCFIYAILASQYPCTNGNTHRVRSYKKYIGTLNTKGIEMPMV